MEDIDKSIILHRDEFLNRTNLKHRGVSKLSLHIDAQMNIPALEEYIVEPDARADERYPWNGDAYRSRILTCEETTK